MQADLDGGDLVRLTLAASVEVAEKLKFRGGAGQWCPQLVGDLGTELSLVPKNRRHPIQQQIESDSQPV